MKILDWQPIGFSEPETTSVSHETVFFNIQFSRINKTQSRDLIKGLLKPICMTATGYRVQINREKLLRPPRISAPFFRSICPQYPFHT